MNGEDKLYIRSTQSGGQSCQTVMALSDIRRYASIHGLRMWIEKDRVVTETVSYPFHQTVYLPITIGG